MLPVPPPAAPERVTAMLRGAGVLERGQVVDVAVESARETLISRITRLRLTYDGGAGPSQVFWKSQREGADPRWQEFGRKEVDFYGLVAADTPAGLLPRCYEASAEPARPWHLVLEDLTASHEAPGSGRCRPRSTAATPSSRPTRDSMPPGGRTRAWAYPSAPSPTSRGRSIGILRPCRPTWPPSPIVSAIGSRPSASSATSGSSRQLRACSSDIARIAT